MKKILTTVMACACLVGFSACDSFLEENPKGTLTSNSYYESEAHALQNINRLYRLGVPNRISSTGAYAGSIVQIQGALTGYFTNTYEGQELIYKYGREMTRQQNTMTVGVSMGAEWQNAYQAINIANTAIANIPNINMDASKVSQYVAEAKLFRAWNYFFLVKLFGDVPFYTEPSDVSNLMLTRTAKATIYSQIETDLKEAVSNLPAKTFADNGHRVSKYVAAMILADVYFYQGKYADAASAIQTVLNSEHALTAHNAEITAANYEETKLESAWNQLRTTDDLDECIYAYEYDGNISKASRWSTMAFDASILAFKGAKYQIAERIYGPVPSYLNVYEEGDMRALPNQFYHWTFTNPNDPTQVWERTEEEGPGAWYFYTYEDLFVDGYSAKDVTLYRYAEALLIAAESIAQSAGVTAEAANCLAEIKARANMEGKSVATMAAELQGLSKEAFIEECWKERLRELPFDFKIWDDCVRTQKFPVISETTKGDVTFVNLVGAKNASGYTIKDSDMLWPISPDEIQRNPNLTQNPGYN